MISYSIEPLETRNFFYKFNQPFNQVVEFCTNFDIFKKINFQELIELNGNSDKKKFFEKDYSMTFIWKKTVKIELITINNHQKQGIFSFSMKIDKINNFKLPINIIINTQFIENSYDNSTIMMYEIRFELFSQNSISNIILNLIINNPYIIQEKEFKMINQFLEQYIYSCKREFSIYESIIINQPFLYIWNIISNSSYLIDIILKIPHHKSISKGEKGKVGSSTLVYNLKTDYVMNFRIKNIKIYKDKIIVHFKKEYNGHKAINNKFKVIITEMSNNISLLQIEHNIPIYCSGIITEKLQNWTKYILSKCKYHLESK